MKALVIALILLLASPAIAGPQCTIAYPRGFTVKHKTIKVHKKKRIIQIPPSCINGDLEETWGGCIKRHRA